MKKLIRCNSGRTRSSSISRWKIVHLDIVIHVVNDQIAASESIDNGSDYFFSQLIEHIMNADFSPYLSLEAMKQKFKSPYSPSEYYVFLRVSDDEKIKLILDIRYSNHRSIQHGRTSAHNRHIGYMKNGRRKEVNEDIGMHADEADVAFMDVAYLDKNDVVEIDIDKQQTFSISEALKVVDSKLSKL